MTLGVIKRHIVSRDKDTIIRLFKGLVRPKLEYCIQSWNPILVKDIELLEQVSIEQLNLSLKFLTCHTRKD